ncbi:adhesion G protein-coupled receptor L4-like [Ruditapes philippinarum]|uniref:adhesion G protein-coupled receptor L4-like n=1 Tax=Ruditapes philippinarum TaxID=129788 RepID=UPI00295BF4CF|nr:adhesion G protein-coupled receptor L4-like [Ruditapes philippinarum]
MRQDGVIVCKCNHLTSFAVLMSLSPGLASHHYKVLSIITQIGLTISMVFLALNVFIFILFWRYVKSAQSIMKLNLSCVLFLANLIFLIGIDKTTNEVVCSTVAVLLHLLYLMVFFVMLVLGLHMLNGVLNPTYLGDNTLRNLLASYGTAVFVVAVSVGSTQLKGYGTDKYCWLSTETGLIWAFLIPVIVIITINFTIVVVVFKIMFNTTQMTRKTSFNRVKAGVRGFIVLLPVMGLTWIIGIFAFDSNMVVFHYLFSILNSLQEYE